MKKTVIKFVSVVILAGLVIFLSSCNGGNVAEGSSGYQSSVMLYLDSIGKIQPGAKGTNLLRVFNESQEDFSFEKAELTSLRAKKPQKLAIDINGTSCNTLKAGKNCQLLVDFSSLASGSYRLQAIFSDKNGSKLSASQLVEIAADANVANQGIELLGYSGGKVIANNGKYHINLPVMLHNKYENIITSQGKLECNHGFESGAICNWLIDGIADKENTTLQLSLDGYNKQKQKTAINYQMDVTTNIQANLLLSEIADIEIGTTPENTQQLAIFNAGNYSASYIDLSVFPKTDLELVNNTCNGIVLRPQSSCEVGVRAIKDNRNGHGMVEATYKINSDGVAEDNANTNILYYTDGVTAAMSFERISGDDGDFVVGDSSRSLVYRLENSGENDVKDISLAVSNGRIATATVAGQTSCAIDGTLKLSMAENCVFQANLVLNDMKPQSLTAQGKYQDEHGVTREINSSDIIMGYLPPEITISSTTGDINAWQTMMGTPFTFTATITGGRSAVTPQISGITNIRVEPASCTLDSQIPSMKKCNFVVASTETLAANRYYAWNPSLASISTNPGAPSVAENHTINLTINTTNSAKINGFSGSYQINNITASIFAPYSYVLAPNRGSVIATVESMGITWNDGSTVDTTVSVQNRFVAGVSSTNAACPVGEQTVYDQATGLTWVASPSSYTSSADLGYTWANAQIKGRGIPSVYCGYIDWRLPSRVELNSLFIYNEAAIDITKVHGLYNSFGFQIRSNHPLQVWSAESRDAIYAYLSSVGQGADTFVSKESKYPVWAVRGGGLSSSALSRVINSSPQTGYQYGFGKIGSANPRFIVVSNGDCLIDKLTGLMWASDITLIRKSLHDEKLNEIESMNTSPIARGYNLCGFTDWRMSNINELNTLSYLSSKEYGFKQELSGYAFDGFVTSYVYGTRSYFSLWWSEMVRGHDYSIATSVVDTSALPVRGGRL